MMRLAKWIALIAALLIAGRFALRYLDATHAPSPAGRTATATAASEENAGGWVPPATWHAPAGVQAQQRGIQTTYGGCSPPAGKSLGSEPLQSPLPKGMQSFTHGEYRLKPLYGFSVDATIMSRKDYSEDREADLAPMDLALAWGRMRDDGIIARLNVTQGGRWYRWQWYKQEPLPSAEIIGSSANMHMIPSDGRVLAALQSLHKGDDVRIDGWLVEARHPDGWVWRSSTSRGDSGQGGCEVVYVCAVTPVPRNPQ